MRCIEIPSQSPKENHLEPFILHYNSFRHSMLKGEDLSLHRSIESFIFFLKKIITYKVAATVIKGHLCLLGGIVVRYEKHLSLIKGRCDSRNHWFFNNIHRIIVYTSTAPTWAPRIK